MVSEKEISNSLINTFMKAQLLQPLPNYLNYRLIVENLAYNLQHASGRNYEVSYFLEEKANEFTPQEILAIVHAMQFGSSVVSSGTVLAYLQVISKTIQRSTSDAIGLLRLSADAVMNYDDPLLTVKEWELAVESGLEGDLPVSLIIPIFIRRKAIPERKITKRLIDFRQLVKGE